VVSFASIQFLRRTFHIICIDLFLECVTLYCQRPFTQKDIFNFIVNINAVAPFIVDLADKREIFGQLLTCK